MSTLLPSAELFHLEAITHQGGRFVFQLQTHRKQAACRTCQTLSNKVHTHYFRHLADLPWAGIPVQFDLQVRKFFCRNDACQQRIFCERLTEVALVYARQTVRLNAYLQQYGWHLGGELSMRLSSLINIQLGADAILQRVRKVTMLVEWEAKGRASELQEFGTFLLGLQRDRTAVENAITQTWSNGAVEGQVNRLKNIKRSMFGRANFDLLKAA